MKMILTFVILMFSVPLYAPFDKVMYIERTEPINYYDPLIKAIVAYESKGDIFAFNFLEQACGPFQIRPCRIAHYNRLEGTNYTTADCFSMELSRKVFMRFTNDKDWEHAAKDWNGSGPLTINYWKEIQARL
jgi:hypothetical protein